MRVFCAVRHSSDPRYFYGGLWSSNFYPALRALGHDIVESQTDLRPTSRFMDVADGFTVEEAALREHTTESILAEVRTAMGQGRIDLFLAYFYNAHFDPKGFDELRRLGIPSINFYCNSVYQFALVAQIARAVDFSWHAERDARQRYVSAGANPIWVPFGADPSIYRSVDGMTRAAKACFVGQRYADRDLLLARLIDADVPVDVFGAGWGADGGPDASASVEPAHFGRARHRPGSLGSYISVARNLVRRHGVVTGVTRFLRRAAQNTQSRRALKTVQPHAKGRASDLAEVFSGYDVSLNFSNVWADGEPGSKLIPHVRLRDFEAPMSGACYLTGHTDEIADLYKIGVEIDTYRNAEELVDKTRFYLGNPAAAEKLRRAGFARARADHTWTLRFQELLRKTGLEAPTA